MKCVGKSFRRWFSCRFCGMLESDTIRAAVAGEKWAKDKVIEHYTPMIDELAVDADMKQHLILKLLEELPHFPMGQA